MRITAMMAMAMAAGMTAQAGQTKKTELRVYVQNNARVPVDVTNQAEYLAFSMFASIGVKIIWRSGQPSASGNALAIELTANTPATEKPGAMAYAKPYEGIRIVVFWDRMDFRPGRAQMLAHVMVHEITHIIEGVCRHSDTGVMKAEWTDEDNKAMIIRPLTFAAEDVDLIHRGLDARNSSSRIEAASR